MTRKQLQSLISAGVFSASLLSGVAYADDNASHAASNTAPGMGATSVTTSSTTTNTTKHKKTKTKAMAAHSCAGQNDCKGQGGCKAGAAGCKGKNACKGQGGCATDGSKK